MRASSKAVTWPVAASPKPWWRASSATANSEFTGSTGTPAPKAKPCATAQAVRRPVKEPGPQPKQMASSSLKVRPDWSISSSTPEIRPMDALAPPSLCCCQRPAAAPSSRETAIDIASVLVSKASSFMIFWLRPGAHQTQCPGSPGPGRSSHSTAGAQPAPARRTGQTAQAPPRSTWWSVPGRRCGSSC